MYVCMHACMHGCIYIYIYIYVCVYVDVYIYIYTQRKHTLFKVPEIFAAASASLSKIAASTQSAKSGCSFHAFGSSSEYNNSHAHTKDQSIIQHSTVTV